MDSTRICYDLAVPLSLDSYFLDLENHTYCFKGDYVTCMLKTFLSWTNDLHIKCLKIFLWSAVKHFDYS